MQKIWKSGLVALAVAVAVGGVTYSFFSDTETSTGNTFTAGAIDLTVDSEQHYNNMVCVENPDQEVGNYWWQPEEGFTPEPGHYPAAETVCDGTWAATDLGAQKFFNFTDVKPGDQGENTISLHIDNNPAWACIDVNLTKNDDVSSTEPELAVPDTLEDGGDDFDGELAQNVKFAAWLDQGSVAGWQNSDEDTGNNDATEGDNIWQGEEVEPLLFSNQSGPASDVLGGKTYTLADSTTFPTVGPIDGGVTNYIGLAWCAGTQVVDTALNTITCDGSTLGNIAQTDMFEASVAFRVEQFRNNPNFTCVRQEEEVVTTLTLAKTVIPAETAPDSAFTLTATGPTNISGIEGAVTVLNAPVTPGVYTLGESGGPETPHTVTWQCSGNATPEGVNTVAIAAGETVTCDVTNNYNPS